MRSGFSSLSLLQGWRKAPTGWAFSRHDVSSSCKRLNLRLSYFDQSIHSLKGHLIIWAFLIQLIDCQLLSCTESLNISVPNLPSSIQQSAPKAFAKNQTCANFSSSTLFGNFNLTTETFRCWRIKILKSVACLLNFLVAMPTFDWCEKSLIIQQQWHFRAHGLF